MDEELVTALCGEATAAAIQKLQEMRGLEGVSLREDLGLHL